DHVVVEPVRTDIGQGGVPLVVKQAGFLVQRGVGPADVHAAGRHLEFRDHDVDPLRVDHGGGAALHDLLDRLHAGPHAAEAAHGDGVNAQVQDVLHRGREKHRQTTGLEDVVAPV